MIAYLLIGIIGTIYMACKGGYEYIRDFIAFARGCNWGRVPKPSLTQKEYNSLTANLDPSHIISQI